MSRLYIVKEGIEIRWGYMFKSGSIMKNPSEMTFYDYLKEVWKNIEFGNTEEFIREELEAGYK